MIATLHALCFRLLKHPNIVNLFGYAVGVHEVVIIMSYIQGRYLDELLFGKDKTLSKVCCTTGNGQ